MKVLLTSLVAVVGFVGPVLAQAPYPEAYLRGPQTAYANPNGWRAISPTPRDAYRDGLISRLELEQLEGPTPQALQGPSPDGNRGGDGGGGGFGQ